jgi:hypothetical protein
MFSPCFFFSLFVCVLCIYSSRVPFSTLLACSWAASSSSSSGAAAAAPADDDDVDLFGSDDEDDGAVEAERNRLLAESEAKKKAKGVIQKSSVIFDVKPFDDETGMYHKYYDFYSSSSSFSFSSLVGWLVGWLVLLL